MIKLLQELGITPTDHWQTKYLDLVCDYFLFGDSYCVSGDGVSYVFSHDGYFLYVGYSLEELKEAIMKELV